MRGECYYRFRLPNNVDKLAVRDLIKLRIKTEVEKFNLQRSLCFYALVQPEGAEITAKGYRLKIHHNIGWQA